jgi:nucleoside-diphosphate-sugar epimerase
MAGKRIFITGSSGLVGNRCLIRALEKGYDVVSSVRSPEKAEFVRRGIQPVVSTENLNFVVIPDIAVEGCFDEHLSEVDYIVHVASPLWTVSDLSDMERAYVQPAVNSTMSILKAAEEAKPVKKVVLCSSLAALTAKEKCFGDDIDGVTYTAENRIPDSHYQPMKDHYFAGKTLARNATDRLVKEGLPFDVINIFPSSVLGRFEPAKTIEELLANSNIRGLAMVIGKTLPPLPTSCVHVNDLAKMHIDVLGMKTEKYHNFGAGIHMSFKEQFEVAKKHFPSAVENGRFPCSGDIPDRQFLFDSKDTEKFFGWKFKSFEDMVFDIATQYLELLPGSAD